MFILPQKIHSGRRIRETPANCARKSGYYPASTVRYTSSATAYNNHTKTDLLHQEGHKCRDFDYASDPDSAGREHDAFNDNIANVSDTEIPNSTPGSLAGKETHYEGSGEVVADVNGFEQECDDLSEDPWAPFTSAQGFKLAS